MKKKLLAAAILGSFSVAAFAGGAHVKLYGLIDLGVTHFTGLASGSSAAGSPTVSSTGLSSGAQSGSRIGIKGSEDLGGGMKVVFAAETGFCAAGLSQDQKAGVGGNPGGGYCSGGGFMQRQAFVGVRGHFGVLTAGRMYTPIFKNEAAMDPFGYGLTGDINNLSIVGKQSNGLLIRANQAINYTTPKLSGFTGTLNYSFAPLAEGTVPTASGKGSNVMRSWSAEAKYASGPVTVGGTYLELTNSMLGLAAGGVNSGSIKVWQAFGAYDFGVAKLRGLYEKASGDYAYGTTSGLAGGGQRFWMLGVTVPVGRGTIMASYDEAKIDPNGVFTEQVGTAKQYALGYTYALSRTTNLYASYGHVSNDAGTSFANQSNTDSFSGVDGQSSTGVAVGIRKLF